jgi:hypothetical protein
MGAVNKGDGSTSTQLITFFLFWLVTSGRAHDGLPSCPFYFSFLKERKGKERIINKGSPNGNKRLVSICI